MVMRGVLRGLVVIGAVAATVGLAPVAASADTATGREYGQHVATCARDMGFDGAHNPGTHRGYVGWSAMPHGMC